MKNFEQLSKKEKKMRWRKQMEKGKPQEEGAQKGDIEKRMEVEK